MWDKGGEEFLAVYAIPRGSFFHIPLPSALSRLAGPLFPVSVFRVLDAWKAVKVPVMGCDGKCKLIYVRLCLTPNNGKPNRGLDCTKSGGSQCMKSC